MRIPLRQMIDLGRYMHAKKRAGEKYFPIVLMLEPLHACNLACIGAPASSMRRCTQPRKPARR